MPEVTVGLSGAQAKRVPALLLHQRLVAARDPRLVGARGRPVAHRQAVPGREVPAAGAWRHGRGGHVRGRGREVRFPRPHPDGGRGRDVDEPGRGRDGAIAARHQQGGRVPLRHHTAPRVDRAEPRHGDDRGRPDLVDVGGGGRVPSRQEGPEARRQEPGRQADRPAQRPGQRHPRLEHPGRPPQEAQHAHHHRRARARHRRQIRARLDSRRPRLRVGVAAAVLLGPRHRQHPRRTVHRFVPVRFRVHGALAATRHHTAHRSVLHDAHQRAHLPHGWIAGRTGWNRSVRIHFFYVCFSPCVHARVCARHLQLCSAHCFFCSSSPAIFALNFSKNFLLTSCR